MRAINILYMIIGLTLIFSSCELLNFDGPNAQFHGAIIDKETGDTIPQDIIDGSVIDYIEQGFEVPEIQRLLFMVDGTFRNNIMFSADYEMIPVRGNFFSPDTVSIHLNAGDNKYDFQVTPYARVEDVHLEIGEQKGKNYLVARFKIDQIAEAPVKSILLSMDKNPNVGLRYNERTFGRNIGKVVGPDDEQVLWMLLTNFKEGQKYYIRVGVLMDIPEAKHNWNKAVRIDPYTLLMP